MRVWTNNTNCGSVTFDVEFNPDDYPEVIGYSVGVSNNDTHSYSKHTFDIDEYQKAKQFYKEEEKILLERTLKKTHNKKVEI